MWVNNTIEDNCEIGARNISEVLTWIYASYAVHDIMRKHTEEAIPMGYTIINGKS